MTEGARRSIRLLGLVLLVAGLALVVALFEPGPQQIATWMGENCAHERHGPAEQCTILDVLDIMLMSPTLILVGGVLTAALRPPGKGPIRIDLSGLRR